MSFKTTAAAATATLKVARATATAGTTIVAELLPAIAALGAYPNISPAALASCELDDGQILIDGVAFDAPAVARVTCYRGALRVVETDGERSYVAHGRHIERDSYGLDPNGAIGRDFWRVNRENFERLGDAIARCAELADLAATPDADADADATDDEAAPIVIPMVRDDDTLRTDHVLAVDSGHGFFWRHAVGAVPRGAEARRVFQGPMVPGPWAYTFGKCQVIDNYGGSGAEAARNREAGIEHTITEGQRVVIDGVVYRVRFHRFGHRGENLHLDPID